MKKIYFLSLLFLFFCFLANAQTLYEDFNYAPAGNIGGNTAGTGTVNNNWTTHSNTLVGTINVLAGSLSYAGLQASTGNKVAIPGSNATVNRDVNRNAGLGATNSVVYFSFLLNIVNSTQLGATHTGNGYTIHLGTASGASAGTFFGRVSARTSGAGFRLGISDYITTFTDWGSDLAFGTTYLVVVKYDLVGTGVADIASLWVNPASLGGAEPGGSITNSAAAGDLATNISATTSICIRNSSATPNAEIDEIRVGTSWAQVTPAAGAPTINVTPNSLSGFVSLSGVPTAEQTYVVDGSLLTNDIVITPPVDFEIATATGGPYTVNPATITLTQTGGVVNPTTIYVRMNATALGIRSGNITHTSTGANNPNVSLTGNVITSEPTLQSSITIPVPTITSTSMVVNFGGGNGAKRVLVARSGSAVNSDPVDGTTYVGNANFGLGTQIGTGNYVVYAGTGNSVSVTGLSPQVTYHFAVYEYNDAGIAGAENFLIPGGTGNETTLSSDGDYRTVATGNWNDLLNWQTRVAGNWVAAVTLPLTTSNVYIQAGHTITVDLALAVCNDLHINSAASSILAIGLNTVEVNGKIRAYTGTAVTTLGADATFYSGQLSTTTVGSVCITSTAGTGKLRFVGNTRQVTLAGEWGNNPPSWDVEFAPNAGQVLTLNTGFKSGNITVVSGTLQSTATEFRADYGGANTGSITVQSGSTLLFSNNFIAIQRVGTASATSHFGTFTVAAGANLEFSGISSPVIGAGTIAFNGTVVYSAAGNQNFPTKGANSAAVDPNTYTNITISGSGNKTLPLAVSCQGVMTFTSGIVVTTVANLLTMNAGSSVSGASNTSFVDGPIAKIGSTGFVFPVGETGTGYVPIEVSNIIGGPETFTAQYFRGDAQTIYPITAIGLSRVSRCEYWTLDRAGAATANVTLHWSSVNNCSATAPYIKDMPSLTVAHSDGINWDSYGVAGNTTGTTSAGTVTWTGVSVFSPFTIGSISFLNPLPISLNYITGTKQGGTHMINWKVTCNSTPTATMSLERSTDGINFTEIYTETADALRCQQPFSHTDATPAKGTNFYRLKMTDASGKYSYSNTIALLNAATGFYILNISPNPVNGPVMKLNLASAQTSPFEIRVFDLAGKLVLRQTVKLTAGYNSINIPVGSLAPGTYQLSGVNAADKPVMTRFVKQ